MNIRGIVTHRLGEDQIDQLDHRRITGIVKQISGFLDLRENGLRILLADILQHLIGHVPVA